MPAALPAADPEIPPTGFTAAHSRLSIVAVETHGQANADSGCGVTLPFIGRFRRQGPTTQLSHLVRQLL